jgi:hypothetical protein
MPHLSHEILYTVVAFLVGSLIGTIAGFCLFGAWLMGWIWGATVPKHLASNGLLSVNGRQRSKIADELPFAWSDKYGFTRDEIGNITYKRKDMQ